MIKCVIFDLDQTLVRLAVNWNQALESVKEVYRKQGIPESLLERYKLSVFSMITELYQEMLKSFPKNRTEEIQRIVWQVLDNHEIKGVAEAEPVPNCRKILTDIKSKGFKVGVVSANSSVAVTQALKKFDLERYIDAVFTRDSPGRMKPSSDHVLACLKALNCTPQNAILVGDNARDMQAARKAGVLAVGLLAEDRQWMEKQGIPSEWRRQRKEELEKSADLTIQDLLEIRSLLKLCQKN